MESPIADLGDRRMIMGRVALIGMVWFWPGTIAWGAELLDFNRDIRPILADHCLTCHGPDDSSRKAGLRLDLREESLKPSGSGAIPIVPGDPEGSEFIQRILAEEQDLVMPPAGAGKPLSDSQKAILRLWVSQGASYRGHWGFEPPSRPALPRVTDIRWTRNPIDTFVLAKLESSGLNPSPEAGKRTWLRRVTLDLTGLPPDLNAVEAFEKDESFDAYEKAVDRLFASPRYGEWMAVSWLDFARYADSNGYQSDSSREMSPWRDWVIDAFNQNLAFDQFTVQQVAGDLLPDPTRDQLVATGFNRNHRLTSEGGSIPEEWRIETVIDRVETTGLTWLGLTLGCARCHDHKYDPLSQKEFYQIFSFFNNVPETGMVGTETKNTEPTVSVPTREQEAQLARLQQIVAESTRLVEERERDIATLIVAWEPGFLRSIADKQSSWNLLLSSSVKSTGGATFTRLDDASWLASGQNPEFDQYEIFSPLPSGRLTGLLLETLPDPSLPNQSLGRYPNGNYVLTGFEAELVVPGLDTLPRLKFVTAEADYSQPGYEANLILDDLPKNGWAISGNDLDKRVQRRLVMKLETPVNVPENATLTVRLKHDAIPQHNIGRLRLSFSSRPREQIGIDTSPTNPSIVAILEISPAERTPAQRLELAKYFRSEVDSPIRQADGALAEAKKNLQLFRDSFPNSMIMRELPEPRDTFVLLRGQYDRPGEKVKASLPASLPPMPAGQPLNRLGLARWMVDPSHPLTSRVWVNRAWEKFFGIGLSRTTENLGTQAEFPSHPELLDWLATEFVRLDWDMKSLQKEIVLSATYRQASKVSPSLHEQDPENRLLARGPRFRLSGEVVRDQALALSGLLVEKLGGASVRPYMPEGVWDETSKYGDLLNYKPDTGAGLHRRTLYTIWKRTAAPPTLLLFDAPNREACTVKRSRTNTPLQALALLNEFTYIEAAQKLAERMIREGGTTVESRLAQGFHLATSRQPTPSELQILVEGFRSDLDRFRGDAEATHRFTSVGGVNHNSEISAEELAAFTLAGNVLLNLDEVVTRE